MKCFYIHSCIRIRGSLTYMELQINIKNVFKVTGFPMSKVCLTISNNEMFPHCRAIKLRKETINQSLVIMRDEMFCGQEKKFSITMVENLDVNVNFNQCNAICVDVRRTMATIYT